MAQTQAEERIVIADFGAVSLFLTGTRYVLEGEIARKCLRAEIEGRGKVWHGPYFTTLGAARKALVRLFKRYLRTPEGQALKEAYEQYLAAAMAGGYVPATPETRSALELADEVLRAYGTLERQEPQRLGRAA